MPQLCIILILSEAPNASKQFNKSKNVIFYGPYTQYYSRIGFFYQGLSDYRSNLDNYGPNNIALVGVQQL